MTRGRLHRRRVREGPLRVHAEWAHHAVRRASRGWPGRTGRVPCSQPRPAGHGASADGLVRRVTTGDGEHRPRGRDRTRRGCRGGGGGGCRRPSRPAGSSHRHRDGDPRRAEPVEGLRPGRAQGDRHPGRRPLAGRTPPQDGLARRAPRCLVRRLARRGVRRDGPVGERQVDARAVHDPPHRADRRPGPPRRRRHPCRGCGEAARDAPTPLQHGVPALRPAAPPARDRQRRVRPRGPRRGPGQAARPSARDHRARRPDRPRRQLSGSAVGRDAAASGPRPRARDEPRCDVLRRAVQRPRSPDPAGHADRGPAPSPRGRQDHGVHHPRPGRGAQARRPHRDHARRRGRAGRTPGGAGGRSGRCLRRRLRPRRAEVARPDAALDHAPGRPGRPDRRTGVPARSRDPDVPRGRGGDGPSDPRRRERRAAWVSWIGRAS